ncbi:MAG: hypothetical protein LBM59_07930 [Ruminococcus sp.]|jgi:hypothetical protein|nr:hypothetical protein [Ruminococcus sp.]
MKEKMLTEEEAEKVVGGCPDPSGMSFLNTSQMVCDNYITRPGLYADPSKAPRMCKYCTHLKNNIIEGKQTYYCEHAQNPRYI